MLDIDAILADGHIDESEVDAIRAEIYADGIIDLDEAQDLFTLADEADSYCDAFATLFIEAITTAVLSDEETPGVVDADEAEFLNAMIMGDGEVSDLERRLLANIRAQATSVHESLMTV